MNRKDQVGPSVGPVPTENLIPTMYIGLVEESSASRAEATVGHYYGASSAPAVPDLAHVPHESRQLSGQPNRSAMRSRGTRRHGVCCAIATGPTAKGVGRVSMRWGSTRS